MFAEAVEIDARVRDGAFAKALHLHSLRIPLD